MEQSKHGAIEQSKHGGYTVYARSGFNENFHDCFV